MIAYAESSAVLAWLLDEKDADAIRACLTDAERVVASTLTSVECARALARGVATDRFDGKDQFAARHLLDNAATTWDTLELTGRVLVRARATFPREPIRTLDALHLATALMFHEVFGSLTMVSLDVRVRENSSRLGFDVFPRSLP